MKSPSARGGRNKLMLRLPALRAQLRNMVNFTVADLFESYDLATTALDRVRLKTPVNPTQVDEYEEICREIEQEVLRYCAELADSPTHPRH